MDVVMYLTPFVDHFRLICRKQQEAVCFAQVDLDRVDALPVRLFATPFPDTTLSPNAVTALRALGETSNGDLMRAADCMEAAARPPSSFYKERRELVRNGLVQKTNNGRSMTSVLAAWSFR